MHDRIRVAEPGPERLVERNVADLVAADRVHQPEAIDVDRHAARGITDPEKVERVERVWRELDPCPDLAEAGGLLEHEHTEAALRQTERNGESTDAAACDDDGSACHASNRCERCQSRFRGNAYAFYVMRFGRLSFTRTAHGKPRLTESNGLLSCRCSESKTTAEGERGAVYITTLYRWGAPQIRFNINDISRIIPGLCPCGGTLKRLDRIFGRNDTMVKLRGVNVFPEAVGAVVVADRRTNGEYVSVVERVGADEREEMTVLIEVPEATLDRDELQRDFERRFKEVRGVRVIVQAVDRGGTDRYTGTSQSSKIKRLLDRR